MTVEMERVLSEMIDMIKSNLLLLLLNDDCLLSFKDYCKDLEDGEYRFLVPYYDLVNLVDEALADLINMNFWYDFRDLE